MTGDPDEVAVVRGHVAEVLGSDVVRVTVVRQFDDGNRHEVYEVARTVDDGLSEPMVVRISLTDDPAEREHATREARVLEALGGVSAPRLLDFRLASGSLARPAMCMSFVTGGQWDLGSARHGDLERLGAIVAGIHGRTVDDLVDVLGPATDLVSYAEERLGSILSTLTWVREPVPGDTRARYLDAAEQLEAGWGRWREAAAFTTGEPIALLHGDIGPGNVLWGPDPVLIDWEYTRLGDPADEIAYLFDQNGLAERARDAFWRGYLGRGGAASVAERVRWWEPLTLLGSSLWWVQRWVRRAEADAGGESDAEVPREAEYYRDHALGRLDRLEPLLQGIQ